jgi:hypothetical protein
VWAVVVLELLVLPKLGLAWCWLMIRMPSRSPRRIEPTKHSVIALAHGTRTGVLMTLIVMGALTV